MNRIILLLLGVASGLWVLRDLGAVSQPCSLKPSVATAVANTDNGPTCASRSRDIKPAVTPGPVVIDSQLRTVGLHGSTAVTAAKYTVLVQDEATASDDDTPELAPPPANATTAADRAALGRWATGVFGALVRGPALVAKSTATSAVEEQRQISDLAKRPMPLVAKPEPSAAPQKSAEPHAADAVATDLPAAGATADGADDDSESSPQAAPDSPKDQAHGAQEADGASAEPAKKPAEKPSDPPAENPADLEKPAVTAAAPEDTLATDEPAASPAKASTPLSAAPAPAAAIAPAPAAKSPAAAATPAESQDTAPVATPQATAPTGAAALLPSATIAPREVAPAARPAPVQPRLSPDMIALWQRVHYALGMYRHQRLLNTGSNVPWEVMHRFVAFGANTEVLRDGPGGEPVNAIGWLLWGGRCDAQPVLVLSGGRPSVLVGVGVQGHPGQFLAMLAQSRVRPDSPFQLEGKPFTVHDLIDQEKLDCDSNIELTFELIAMSYYLKTDDTWTSRNGEQWSIARLVHEEIRQPINGAACGGSHRLFGLSAAFKKRMIEGKPIDGEFLRAQRYIRAYQNYAVSTLENGDGSFSTDWFRRPADNGKLDRKIQTTGHILEWLVFSSDESQLRDPRIIRSVDFLATQIIMHPNHSWSVGPFGHALHAIALYESRVFTPSAPQFLQPRPFAAQAAAAAVHRQAAQAASLPRRLAAESRPRQASLPPHPKADPARAAERPTAYPAIRPSIGTPNAASATAELQGPDLGVTR